MISPLGSRGNVAGAMALSGRRGWDQDFNTLGEGHLPNRREGRK